MERLPKSYSDQERAYITKHLKEEAAACMGQFGIRRTTVDELVKRVKIPKGTFYHFYPSKELLLFEVIQEQHELVNQKLYQTLSGLSEEAFSAEKITDVIFGFYKMTEEMPVFRLMDSEDISNGSEREKRSFQGHAVKRGVSLIPFGINCLFSFFSNQMDNYCNHNDCGNHADQREPCVYDTLKHSIPFNIFR